MYGWDRVYFVTFVVLCKLQNPRYHRCGPCTLARVMLSRDPPPAAVFLALPLEVLPQAPHPHAPLQPCARGSWLLAEPQRSFSILAQAQPSGLCSRI